MKNAFLLLLFAQSLTGFSQSLLGANVGISLMNMTFKQLDTKFRPAIVGGVDYEHFLNEHFSVETGLAYSAHGYKSDAFFTEDGLTGSTTTLKFNCNYLSVPVDFGFNFGGKLGGSVNLGVMPSILLHAVGKDPVDGKISETVAVHTIDIAGLAGAGLTYKLKPQYWLTSSLHFERGLTHIADQSDLSSYGFVLSFGVKYLLGAPQSPKGEAAAPVKP